MRTILVATDFSDAAHNAAVYAAELARISGAKILLYHANYVPSISANKVLVTGVDDDERSVKKNKQLLEEEATLLNKLSGVVVDCLLTEGAAAKEIIAVQKMQTPDLVIAGMKESNNFRKFLFGSVATDVINETLTPIIIVPEKFRFKYIERIAFGIDFDLKRELQMHSTIKDLFQLFKPNTFLINIVKEGSEIRPNDCVSERNVEKYFENKEHLYCFLEHNDLIRGLKDFVSWHKIDLMVMMPHERNLLGKIFAESHTKKMAFNTDIPLLILPLV